jgi:hypothetical protein
MTIYLQTRTQHVTKVNVKILLRLTASQLVCLGVRHLSEDHYNTFLLSDNCGVVVV